MKYLLLPGFRGSQRWGPRDRYNTSDLLTYLQQTWEQNKKQYTKNENMVQNGPIIILYIFRIYLRLKPFDLD
jgi:hypothetical protein